MKLIGLLSVAIAVWGLVSMHAAADEPTAAYIFPAGGQRGKTVEVHVGGTFFHGTAPWQMFGPGVTASPEVKETETLWLEGPPLHHPDSSRKEDYPRDHAASIAIAADAPLGTRLWRVWTSQGSTENRPFIVGDLPEVIENETETGPTPIPVTLPVTINGRIFPRQEIDVWSFSAEAGQEVTCAVVARALGSKIETRLEVLGPDQRVLAESIDTAGNDPVLRFKAPVDGQYQVRIFDANFEGMQDFVYRLTVTAGPYIDSVYPLGGRRGEEVAFQLTGQGLPETLSYRFPGDAPERVETSWSVAGVPTNQVSLAVGDLPEALEAEPNESPEAATAFSLPATLNGRIDKPGDVDLWSFTAEKGAVIEFELSAARLGSKLDSVLEIHDESGKIVAKNDDLAGNQTDSRVTFTAPEAGRYYVQVAERFSSRGGKDFGYRMRAALAGAEPDFRLQLADDVVTLFRDLEPGPDGQPTVRQPQRRRLKPAQLKIDVQRFNGFAEEIEIVVDGLPAGVTVTGTKIGKNANATTLNFKAAYETKIGTAQLKIRGEAKAGETTLMKSAEYPARMGMALDHVYLAVALDAPFRVTGEFAMAFGAAGSVYEKAYKLERFGYDGPLTVRLSDRQMRHLQGVTGPTITIPPGGTSFVYPVTLAPWMNLGRTSRSVVMAIATVYDHDGSEHVVSYYSDHQNEQVVAVVKPGLLTLSLPDPHLRLSPGSEAPLNVRIQRADSLAGREVRLELRLPVGVSGISAESIILAADEDSAILPIQFAPEALVPALPVVVHATTLGGDSPCNAEAELELLSPVSR